MDFFEGWVGVTIRCPLNSAVYRDAERAGITVDTSTMPPQFLKDENGVIYVFDEK